jgi:hypothetical protein
MKLPCNEREKERKRERERESSTDMASPLYSAFPLGFWWMEMAFLRVPSPGSFGAKPSLHSAAPSLVLYAHKQRKARAGNHKNDVPVRTPAAMSSGNGIRMIMPILPA